MQSTMTDGSGHTCGKGPNHGGGQSRSKCPMYEELNVPQLSNWPPLSNSVLRSGSEGPSFGLKVDQTHRYK
jgi:hypothetical protein